MVKNEWINAILPGVIPPWATCLVSSTREMWRLKDKGGMFFLFPAPTRLQSCGCRTTSSDWRNRLTQRKELVSGRLPTWFPIVYLSIQCPSVMRRAFHLGTEMPSALRYCKAHRWMQNVCAYWNEVIWDHIWSSLKHCSRQRRRRRGWGDQHSVDINP